MNGKTFKDSFFEWMTTDRIVVLFLGASLVISLVYSGNSSELSMSIASGFVGYIGKTVVDSSSSSKLAKDIASSLATSLNQNWSNETKEQIAKETVQAVIPTVVSAVSQKIAAKKEG